MGPPLPRVRHACRPAKPGTGPPFAPRLPAADPSSGAGETGRRSRPRRTAAILPASGPALTFSAYGSGMSRLSPAIPLRRPQVGRSFPHGGRKNKLTASCRSLRQYLADMLGRAASPPAVPVSPPCGWRPSSPVPHGVGGNMASEQALRPVRRAPAACCPASSDGPGPLAASRLLPTTRLSPTASGTRQRPTARPSPCPFRLHFK